VLIASCTSVPSKTETGWTLVWSDEFDGTELDRTNWAPEKSGWGGGNPDAPFDQPFYTMANLAIGGKLSETNDNKGLADGVVPAEFAIDWIRIYNCAEDRETGLACMQSLEGDE
jgi:beta-glucanase (GH16 family)